MIVFSLVGFCCVKLWFAVTCSHVTVLSASLDAVNGAPLVVDPHSDVCLFLLSCALATVVVLFTVQKEEKSDFKLSFFFIFPKYSSLYKGMRYSIYSTLSTCDPVSPSGRRPGS